MIIKMVLSVKLKLLKKKHALEKFIEEKVTENKQAKKQLERELEEIKAKIDDLGKIEHVEPESEERENLNLKWLESIQRKIEAKQKELECPVCLEVAASPIFCCDDQHIICCKCRPKVKILSKLRSCGCRVSSEKVHLQNSVPPLLLHPLFVC